jgi:hypothetical protein
MWSLVGDSARKRKEKGELLKGGKLSSESKTTVTRPTFDYRAGSTAKLRLGGAHL